MREFRDTETARQVYNLVTDLGGGSTFDAAFGHRCMRIDVLILRPAPECKKDRGYPRIPGSSAIIRRKYLAARRDACPR